MISVTLTAHMTWERNRKDLRATLFFVQLVTHIRYSVDEECEVAMFQESNFTSCLLDNRNGIRNVLKLATLKEDFDRRRQAPTYIFPPSGEPGVNYPTYSSIPSGLAFDCRGQAPGYYADPQTNCQGLRLVV
ncbi:unnamed protein product [Cyprideis torosa]|uniref:Uncharacterized protein n=1 Tax=Cyprideis torosa TaxID=163714 RepID=A0A7R8WCU7_9CRUS|nr:unnamed protein product [Cyprideis torosa]CAG0893903.1 unnamed protein product [Cyprideis torosa]